MKLETLSNKPQTSLNDALEFLVDTVKNSTGIEGRNCSNCGSNCNKCGTSSNCQSCGQNRCKRSL